MFMGFFTSKTSPITHLENLLGSQLGSHFQISGFPVISTTFLRGLKAINQIDMCKNNISVFVTLPG